LSPPVFIFVPWHHCLLNMGLRYTLVTHTLAVRVKSFNAYNRQYALKL
jgi:hypothetical protein